MGDGGPGGEPPGHHGALPQGDLATPALGGEEHCGGGLKPWKQGTKTEHRP